MNLPLILKFFLLHWCLLFDSRHQCCLLFDVCCLIPHSFIVFNIIFLRTHFLTSLLCGKPAETLPHGREGGLEGSLDRVLLCRPFKSDPVWRKNGIWQIRECQTLLQPETSDADKFLCSNFGILKVARALKHQVDLKVKQENLKLKLLKFSPRLPSETQDLCDWRRTLLWWWS